MFKKCLGVELGLRLAALDVSLHTASRVQLFRFAAGVRGMVSE